MTDKQAKERSATRAEERFVVDVQVFLQELMEEKGLSRSDLAGACRKCAGRSAGN
jgi:hypothetical protein